MTATTQSTTDAPATDEPTTDQPTSDQPTTDEALVVIDGIEYCSIPDVDRMPPFLTSIVSDGDRWAFASSAGPLTAGRGSAERALFPYETDDRLHVAAGVIGPVTSVRIGTATWHPFRERGPIRRRLLKSVIGDRLVLEEQHLPTGLVVRATWASCERFGFVRRVLLLNPGDERLDLEVLDGLVGVLPFGVDPVTHLRMSNLVHAYQRNELVDAASRLAVFSLESPVSDRPEPREVLRSTVVWSIGSFQASVHLDPAVIDAFEDGRDPAAPPLVTGRAGAYLLRGRISLAPGAESSWLFGADVARSQDDVVALRSLLRTGAVTAASIAEEIDRGSARLWTIMAGADASQHTADRVACAHHVANVTYNVMRGGVPLDGHRIGRDDLRAFVAHRDRRVARRHASWFAELPDHLAVDEARERAERTGDAHLSRLVGEYLPFAFSRRHGDPSRPWNTFSIRVADDEGAPIIHFEGNWRDVFQNWEALCSSFPAFFPSVIALFLDASTVDGHNPYRITRDGVDWEVPDPDDPWSNIGYWGDHQIVYLLRLVEAAERFDPGSVTAELGRRACTFADVPYRIAPYEQLIVDPKSTITFDEATEAAVADRVTEVGADGRLVADASGEPVLVTVLEKLLVAGLAKLGNFVPGAGIWMNTQRPEWNDANNALVGYGASMVTLFHLRQYLQRLQALSASLPAPVMVSAEVVSWLRATAEALRATPIAATDGDADRHRKHLLDLLGTAASAYRASVYDGGFSGTFEPVGAAEVTELCEAALTHLDATIRSARRDDGLYHAYQILEIDLDGDRISVQPLDEMLEGQVAVLNCGVLDAREQLEVVEALFDSALYRPDQRSFLLAPVRSLPAFLDKGVIAPADVESNALLDALVRAGESSLVRVDVDGTHRFHPDLVDEAHLIDALDRLGRDDRWAALVDEHRDETRRLYERVFRHRAFIGRSGSMYAYEGIGSIYWHMVTKLLLAVQEALVAAIDDGAPDDVVAGLAAAYRRVRSGLGVEKTAQEFGAVPTDPYSHTPAHAGAQQPGMTGAVKEELLARRLELGVRVRDGRLVFDPVLLREDELLTAPGRWAPDPSDDGASVEVPTGSVASTVCQVPVVVQRADGGGASVEVRFVDGRIDRREGAVLDRATSAAIFRRDGTVAEVRAVVTGR